MHSDYIWNTYLVNSGVIRRCCRCGRIQIAPINVSHVQKVEKTYQIHASMAQPCGNDLKQSDRVIGPWHQCIPIKIRSAKLEIERLNEKKQQDDEITHLEHAHTAQPPANASKRSQEVYRPKHQHGQIKFEPTNVSRALEIEETHLGCINVIHSKWRPKKGIKRLDGLTFKSRTHGEHCCRCRRPKFEATNVSIAQEDETAYLECASTAQPHRNILKRACRVVGPRCRCGHIKLGPRNVSRMQNSRGTYLGCTIALWLIWGPEKQCRTISKLTFWIRMLGEYWCDVEDYEWSPVHVAIITETVRACY